MEEYSYEKVEMKVYFKSDVEKVFNVITNMKDCSWRSDLSKVVCIDDGKYIEYNRKNHPTKILVTEYLKISNLNMIFKMNIIKDTGVDNLLH